MQDRAANGRDKQISAEQILVVPHGSAVIGVFERKRTEGRFARIVGVVRLRIDIGKQAVAQ